MTLRRFAAALLAAAAISAFCAAQEIPYPVYETDKISPAEYRERRAKLKAQLGSGALAVYFTNPHHIRNNDVEFTFRADSGFLYLTGMEEPNAALILAPDGFDLNGKRVTEALFCTVPNAGTLTWLGYFMGPLNATRLLGVEAALSHADFEKTLQAAASAAKAFGGRLSVGPMPVGPTGPLKRMVDAFEAWRSSAGFSNGLNVRNTVRTMREIKSPAEIALLKKAAEISALAHVEAMRSIEPGMREWEIRALVMYVFAKEGCEAPGYDPIVGSGPNSCILHYMSCRRQMLAGDIVCMDTAGEYHGYSADVTRSFPVSGKFSPEQRAIYEVVLAAQDAGIALCKPGVTTREIGQKVSETLAAGLVRLGIIKSAAELGTYYMHGFGHGIGLDVHDPMPRTLAPGAVLTVEPGIYIKEGSPCDRKWWNIGIRIEDDIVVTESGPLNLSAGAPRSVAEIERLMAEKGLGNQPLRPWKPQPANR